MGTSYDSREPKMIRFALVDQTYMDEASLHVEIFKKKTWNECYAQL